GRNGPEPLGLAHGLEFAHRQLARAPHVDGPEQRDIGGHLPRPASSSWAKSSSDNSIPAAATFSSRCLTLDVPGMGSITGLRFKAHASAIWLGVASCFLATSSSTDPGLARLPAASGNHGMNPIPSFSQ